jgi:hypothetical protein
MEVEAVSELLGIARFTFHEGKGDDFKRLSEQCMEIVRTKDNGTLQYDIYFNDDESEARCPPVAAGSLRRPPPGHPGVWPASPPRAAQPGRCPARTP